MKFIDRMPPRLAYQTGTLVGALLFPGVYLVTKLMTGWQTLCL